MTFGTPRPRSRTALRGTQLLVVIAVVAVFVAGIVIGGALGALLVGAVAVAAGVVLALRWPVLDRSTRAFRLVAVLVGVAVAASLLMH